MDWQQAVSLGIVIAVMAAFAWSRLRPRRFDFKRDTHCGCSSPGEAADKSSIIFHARKGGRPEVIVKMK
ncbi:MAG: hypothetical protein WDM76_12810 [Limisphaerales bacterium]